MVSQRELAEMEHAHAAMQKKDHRRHRQRFRQVLLVLAAILIVAAGVLAVFVL